jgi:hypothetical protein
MRTFCTLFVMMEFHLIATDQTDLNLACGARCHCRSPISPRPRSRLGRVSQPPRHRRRRRRRRAHPLLRHGRGALGRHRPSPRLASQRHVRHRPALRVLHLRRRLRHRHLLLASRAGRRGPAAPDGHERGRAAGRRARTAARQRLDAVLGPAGLLRRHLPVLEPLRQVLCARSCVEAAAGTEKEKEQREGLCSARTCTSPTNSTHSSTSTSRSIRHRKKRWPLLHRCFTHIVGGHTRTCTRTPTPTHTNTRSPLRGIPAAARWSGRPAPLSLSPPLYLSLSH